MRLITRGDLDGLASAVVLSHHEEISEILLVHPQDITDRRVEVREGDVIANLPYHPECGLWFDHHLVSAAALEPPEDFEGRYALAPSAAQLVWEHYGEDERFERLIEETNRLDSAQLTEDDVLHPEGYVLLGYTLDGRTGLGAYEFYFRQCVDWVRELPIEAVLHKPMVSERVRRMSEEDRNFRERLEACSKLLGNVVFTDFRDEFLLPIGNRFLIYLLFPDANVSLRVHWGPEKKFIVAAVAHSIFNRTCQTNVGELMARYGGGGHAGAGSTPIPTEEADRAIEEILEALRED